MFSLYSVFPHYSAATSAANSFEWIWAGQPTITISLLSQHSNKYSLQMQCPQKEVQIISIISNY